MTEHPEALRKYPYPRELTTHLITCGVVAGLGLSESQRLFCWPHWPLEFQRSFMESRSHSADDRALIFTRRIAHFLRTNGQQ